MNIPRLTTPRLTLRAFTRADLAAYAAICADEEVMRHIGTGGPVEPDAAWRHVAFYLGSWALQGHGMWALESRADGTLLGRVGFIDAPGWPGCELGWLLARSAWGQGYGQEAARAALGFGRDEQGLADVISLVRPANTRSIKLAESLGAQNTGPIDFLGDTTLRYRHAP